MCRRFAKTPSYHFWFVKTVRDEGADLSHTAQTRLLCIWRELWQKTFPKRPNREDLLLMASGLTDVLEDPDQQLILDELPLDSPLIFIILDRLLSATRSKAIDQWRRYFLVFPKMLQREQSPTIRSMAAQTALRHLSGKNKPGQGELLQMLTPLIDETLQESPLVRREMRRLRMIS